MNFFVSISISHLVIAGLTRNLPVNYGIADQVRNDEGIHFIIITNIIFYVYEIIITGIIKTVINFIAKDV